MGGVTEDASEPADSKGSDFISDHQKIVAQYKRQKLSRERQADTLSKLKEFKSRLKDARSGASRDDAVSQATPASAADNAAYDGKVNKNIDHRSYMPASWRVRPFLACIQRHLIHVDLTHAAAYSIHLPPLNYTFLTSSCLLVKASIDM